MRMAQLADAMAHCRSRVTHTVARMEAAGYITRGTTPEDGRGVVATMTDQGYALLAGRARATSRACAPTRRPGRRRRLRRLGRVLNAVADHLVAAPPGERDPAGVTPTRAQSGLSRG